VRGPRRPTLMRNSDNAPKRTEGTLGSSFSYEHRILETLSAIDHFCEAEQIPYAVFGGSGVAAYIGHLPRKIHDVDLLALDADIPRLDRFLRKRQFARANTYKSRKAHFLKYSLENHLYQQVVTIFPGKFVLLNIADPGLRPLEEFDFRESICSSKKRDIKTLRTTGDAGASVRVLRIEDLLISKLWPVIEPTTVHDSFYLLSTVIAPGAVEFDWDYFCTRLHSTTAIKKLCLDTFSELIELYPRSVWSRGFGDRSAFGNTIHKLGEAIRDAMRPAGESAASLFQSLLER